MKKKDKALIVTAVGVSLALIIALLNYFEPFADKSAAFTFWLIISPIWAFCVAPAYVWEYLWLKRLEEGLSPYEAMRRSMLVAALHWGMLILLPLIAAPVLAVLYYVNVFKKVN